MWLRTEDIVIQRCADFLKKETKSWATRADEAIGKLATLLELDIVQVDAQLDAQCSIFDDSDDEDQLSVAGPSGLSQRRGSATQRNYYDSNDATIQSELKKFLSQAPEHFVRCKFISDHRIRISKFAFISLDARYKIYFSLQG